MDNLIWKTKMFIDAYYSVLVTVLFEIYYKNKTKDNIYYICGSNPTDKIV